MNTIRSFYLLSLIFYALFLNKSLAIDYVSNANTAWNTTSTWTPSGIPGSTDNVSISHTVTLVRDESVNNLTITGGSLSVGSYQLTINGNFSCTSTGLVTTNSSKLVLNGAGNQFVFPASVTQLQKLTMNRTNGASSDHDLTFSNNVPADSIVFVFTNGILSMSGTTRVILHSWAVKTTFNAHDGSYVYGWVSRFIKKGMWYDFPVGDNNHYRRMSLSTNSGNAANDNQNKVKYYYVAHYDYRDYDSGDFPGGITDKYYWDQEKIDGAQTKRRFYYNLSDFPDGTTASDISIGNYETSTSTQWKKPTGGPPVNNTLSQYVETKTDDASNDLPWTFASINPASPMPVEIMSFTGKFDKGKVILNWKTASEKNNKGYTVQISQNAKNYSDLTFVKGNGTTTKISNYSYTDLSKKMVNLYYYRLKQEDTDGKIAYSGTVSVVCETEVGEMQVSSLYPNPVSGGSTSKVNISLPSDGKVEVVIYNMMGQQVKLFEKDMLAGESVLEIDTENLAAGTYAYSIKFNLKSINGKFTHLSTPTEKDKKKDKKDEVIEEDDDLK